MIVLWLCGTSPGRSTRAAAYAVPNTPDTRHNVTSWAHEESLRRSLRRFLVRRSSCLVGLVVRPGRLGRFAPAKGRCTSWRRHQWGVALQLNETYLSEMLDWRLGVAEPARWAVC